MKTLEVGGLGAALQALRLPFGKEARSDVKPYDGLHEFAGGYCGYSTRIGVNPEDIKLISALVRRGDEHAKVLRGVVVWCEVNAPRYVELEMDTYRVGAERLSSNSTMHQECKGLSEDDLIEAKEHMEEGAMQKRVWMFSYQTLRRIYFQRRNHRLPQWRKFCGWIRTLPYADEFILCERSGKLP